MNTKKNSKKDGMSTFKGRSIRFDDKYLHVELKDGRIISTPMKWYKELQKATLKELSHYHFICQGTGIEWPSLDYQLSVESMIFGVSQKSVA